MSAAAETLVIREASDRVFSPLRSGTLLGAYEILDLIGQGAIGLVYLAQHTKLKRKVALKVLRDELASNEKAVVRFFGEARAVNEIAHEHIVEITDFVEADPSRGIPSHFIMELLEGRTLKETMEQERLSLDRILDIGLQIASALAAVHEKQIVHRDLKPANIFIVDGEQRDFVKLLDFGIAKLSTALLHGEPNTGSGMIIGTPGYMAPEQIQSMGLDGRADVYALGVVLFEMAAGRAPFLEEDLLELLYKHCDLDPPSPIEVAQGGEHIPRALSRLILDCLKKIPEERPQSAGEVHDRLLAIAKRRRIRRRLVPASWVAGAAACAFGVLGLGGKSDHGTVVAVQEVSAEPAVPTHVLLRFASDPPGAEVMVGEEIIGRTPCAHAFERGHGSLRFSYHLPSYEPIEEEIGLDADAHVQIMLKPIQGPVREPSITIAKKAVKKKRGAISRAEIKNPFE